MARKIINIRNCFLWNHVVSRTIGSISHPIMVILRLKLSCRSTRGWKFLETESFSGLKVSGGWKFLRAESFSGLKMSFNPRAESFSRLKLSQLKVYHGWKCLLESGLQVSCSWKCLRADSVLETRVCQFRNIKTSSAPFKTVQKKSLLSGLSPEIPKCCWCYTAEKILIQISLFASI